MSNLRKAVERLKFTGKARFDESMIPHTSFRVGGAADAVLFPESPEDVAKIMRLRTEFPIFILGAGANILVSDRGIRGIVIKMHAMSSCRLSDGLLVAGAGQMISDSSRFAGERGFSGLEFIYAMPGTVGGSVWMNARCYARSVSDILAYADVIDETSTQRRIIPAQDEFAYKISPFQKQPWAIVEAGFRVRPGDRNKIMRTMTEHKEDRNQKGHFAAPSAGSVFKNNRDFGEPSGRIIDSLGMRGERIGGAVISDLHANIITNSGGATATDILQLMQLVERKVKESRGYDLEREVRLVGDWPGESVV